MNQEYFEIELPGLKLYDGLEKLQIKKITPFIHKKILSTASISNDPAKLVDILNDLIINYDVNELNLDDLSYILFQIRLTCYNMIPIEIYFSCSECTEDNKITLDPKVLDIVEKDTYPTVMLENFGEVTIRYRKVKDDALIEKFLKEKKLDSNDLFYRTLVVDALVLDQWKPLEEVWKLMEDGTITVQDTLKIENALTTNAYGVKEELTYECRHCHKEVTQEFHLTLGDYFPPTLA